MSDTVHIFKCWNSSVTSVEVVLAYSVCLIIMIEEIMGIANL